MLLIFDENFPPDFVNGFSIMQRADKASPIKVEVTTVKDFMGKIGATDHEIIIAADNRNAVIVTHDSDFKRIKHYKPLLDKHKVGYIYFKTPKKQVYWDIVKKFVNNWDEIKTAVSEAEHPFAFEIAKIGGITRLDF